MTLCSIHGVAFGGDGVGKVQGLAVFVPFTLPGELVEVEIVQKKRNFAKGKIQKLIEVSKDRVSPPCPYFSKCGGCPLQHASYPLQLELKKRFVEDSLSRIGNIRYAVPSVVPSSDEFGYRRHISLKLKLSQDIFQLGFSAMEGYHLPVQSCLLLEEAKGSIVAVLQKAAAKLNPGLPLSDSSVKIIKLSKNSYLIACNFTAPLPLDAQNMLKDFFKSVPQIAGWILKTPTQELKSGEVSPSFSHSGLTFAYSPFGFVQNHPEQSGRIYDHIVEAHKSSKKILDLYCGIGVSTLLLARDGKTVLGVELNPASVELAKLNAEQNKVSGAEFLCSSAEASTRKILDSFGPDALVINPPKAGIDTEVLQEIAKSSIERITYVSCNPPTLARDLAYLLKSGFELGEVQPFDMFPQTTHVETIVQLHKKITAH